jgi:apolipoprotein N-acyltransferase
VLLLIGLGGLATLALPPLTLWPVLLIVIPVLVRTLDPARGHWAQARDGWCFGFGYFLFGLYWIAFALPTASESLWWAVPFAAAGLPAGLAIFTALAVAAIGRVRDPLARGLGFAVAWSAVEYGRSILLTGFPWNLIGHAWAESEWLSQGAAIVGVHGLGAVVMTMAALPSALPEAAQRGRMLLIGAALALPAVAAGFGAARLSGQPATVTGDTPFIGLRLVQPSIPQREKWDRAYRARNFSEHALLSMENRPDWVQAVIWGETAVAFYLDETPTALAGLGQVAPVGGYVITGAPRRETEPLRLFNSLFAIDSAGAVVARFDKAHLVPFGEYMPLRDILPLRQIVEGSIGYTPGPGPGTVTLDGLPGFAALICYEVIFPGAVIGPGARPAWMLNLTNDAWYGHTAGPHQHWAQTRMRAIEEGIPIVRVASTGITGATDRFGRVLGSLDLGAVGYLDLRLPLAADPEPTPWARFGMLAWAIWLAGIAALAVALARRNEKAHE